MIETLSAIARRTIRQHHKVRRRGLEPLVATCKWWVHCRFASVLKVVVGARIELALEAYETSAIAKRTLLSGCRGES